MKEEFEEVKEQLFGKIVVVSRGSNFLETAELAKFYGVGAIILVDNDRDELLGEYRGRNNNTLPFFVVSYYDGKNLVNENPQVIKFNNFNEKILESKLAESSSRGPVLTTYEIKPDITSHGTNVLSTFPYFGVIDGGIEGDYSEAYARISGTSMASPHIAGAAALLKQYGRDNGKEWDAAEIKARLMNSAYKLDIPYGVNEIGAGFADAFKAVYADTYITVEKDNVALPNTDSEASFDTASFSFGLKLIGEDTKAESFTRKATIHNEGSAEKTFIISHNFNDEGQNVKLVDGTGIVLSFSSDEISVAAGATSDFNATISIPANLEEEKSGYYDGYVILTNKDNEEEVYTLPFMVNCMANAPVLEEGNYFLNRPVISTGPYKQNSLCGIVEFYFNQSYPGNYTFDIYEYNDNYDLNNLDGSTEVGFLQTVVQAYWYPTNQWWVQTIMEDGKYYTVDGPNLVEKILDEGHYKIVIHAENESGDYSYMYDADLIVDNKAPELNVEFNVGDYNSVFAENGIVNITGNVFDDNVEYMAEKEIYFKIYEDGDILHNVMDQRFTQVIAVVGEESYKADVNPDGCFSIEIPYDSDEPIEAKIYAVDGFSVFNISQKNDLESTEGFDPELPSFKFEVDGGKYAFSGSNIAMTEIVIENNAPNAMIKPKTVSMMAGEAKELEVLFNKLSKDIEDSISYYESSDPSVVSVTNTGDKATTMLKALKGGFATVTAYSKKGLVLNCEVKVTELLSNGLNIAPNDYIYYGAMDHTSGVTVEKFIDDRGRPDFRYIINYEGMEKPILWKVMGEEIVDDDTSDGYLSLLSKYVLDIRKFSGDFAYPMYYNYSPNQASYVTVKHYLNGGWYTESRPDPIKWWEYIHTPVYKESEFYNNFGNGELSTIPTIANKVSYYNALYKLDKMFPPYLVKDEKFYLPWTINGILDGLEKDSVFWSAGDSLNEHNALMFKEFNKDNNANIISTYKNGNIASYWVETVVPMGFAAQAIIGIGSDTSMGMLSTLDMMGVNARREQSIRPGTKLDPNSIVFAYEINNSGDKGTIRPDENYTITENSESKYFKLSVLGENNGEDIGNLMGVKEAYKVKKGEDLILNDVTSSSNAEYDIIAYKIVSDNGKLVKYDEILDINDLTLDTSDFEEDDYKVYIWLQKNNEIRSNETGVVSVFDLYVRDNNFVSEITLNQNGVEMTVGQNFKLVANVDLIDPSDVEIIFGTDNPSVATVESDGTIIANSVGEVVITARVAGQRDIYAEAEITVEANSDAKIYLNKSIFKLSEGETYMLKTYLRPVESKIESMAWSSSNKEIAIVDKNGLVTAVSSGMATITVTADIILGNVLYTVTAES